MEWLRRILGWSGWTVAALALATTAAQLDASPGWFIASVQALTPWLLPLVVIVGVASIWADRRLTAACLVAVVALGILVLPLVTSPSGRPAEPTSVEVSVASVNLLDINQDVHAAIDDVARANADIIGFVEVTGSVGRALASHPLEDSYPYKISLAGNGPKAGRTLWSRYPIVQENANVGQNYVLVAVADTPNGQLRVGLTHIPSAFKDAVVWSTELGRVPDLVAASDLPTVVMGDFNASYFHPPFRSMMATSGLIDGLPATGKRFTMTWPNDRFIGPFVALDHILVTPNLAVVDGGSFDVTGSDHAGVVASIATAATD